MSLRGGGFRDSWAAAILWLGALHGQGAAGGPPAPLPEGERGIAAKYAGDAGIELDPAAVFRDDFESGNLRGKWDVVFHDSTIRLVEEPGNVNGGRKALEFTFPQRADAVGNGVMKRLKEERDILFLRFYTKYEKGLDVTGAGSFHNGGSISAHYHVDGRSTPGKRADGRNKFLVNYEATVHSKAPPPGHLMAYVYHPEQRDDYGDIFFPSGRVQPNPVKPADFGSGFVSRPDVVPELDRWQCFEFMVKANTVGRRDGRIACWLEGRLIADFPNMRFRDVETLRIDYFSVGGYINPNKVRTNRIWYDDVVAATSYIGPMAGARRRAEAQPGVRKRD